MPESTCWRQMYRTWPGSLNVRVHRSPGRSVLESNVPSSAVTVCRFNPSLTQVTLLPTATPMAAGA